MSNKCWIAGLIIMLILLLAPFALGKAKKIQREDLAAYIQRMQPQGSGTALGQCGESLGGQWPPGVSDRRLQSWTGR